MPRFRIATIIERVELYEFDAQSHEEAVRLFREGQLDGEGQHGDFVCERDPELHVRHEGHWVDIPVSDEQWEGEDAPDASL